MDGDKRRKELLHILKQSDSPISGTKLAELLHVSRQIIVQDIALLRAVDKSILATNKGYVMESKGEKEGVTAILAVSHSDEEMEDELNTIVDFGGRVLDVVVEHDVYGQIAVDLVIKSRRDVREFIEKCRHSETKPLKELTNHRHYHSIEAEDVETINLIKNALNEKGYLIFS